MGAEGCSGLRATGLKALVAWGSLIWLPGDHCRFRRGLIFHIGGFGALTFSTLVVSARSHFPHWWFRRGLIFDIGGFGACATLDCTGGKLKLRRRCPELCVVSIWVAVGFFRVVERAFSHLVRSGRCRHLIVLHVRSGRCRLFSSCGFERFDVPRRPCVCAHMVYENARDRQVTTTTATMPRTHSRPPPGRD